MAANMASSDPENTDKSAQALREDLEKGLRFLHTLGMQSKIDLVDLNTRILALVELLVGSGTLDLRAYEERRAKVSDREAERMNKEGHVHVLVGNEENKYALKDLPEVDCEALRPVCQARCCKLGFLLTLQDLDEGIRWSYSNPYHIGQAEDGICFHSDRQTGLCKIYDKRPAVCRGYDCSKDQRIWKDFENRILAEPDGEAPST